MSWFQLDPQSIADRARGATARAPSLAESLVRGALGFTIVSVGGFVPWVFFGHWFHQIGGDGVMYAACALTFIILSGLLLHRLIIGAGSLLRFYKLFSLSFAAYSSGWILGYMALHGYAGSTVGLLAGTVAMGLLFALAFDAMHAVLSVMAALFVCNAIGYFAGWPIELALMATHPTIAKFQWSIVYGLGFGAGLGVAFYLCQSRARALLASNS